MLKWEQKIVQKGYDSLDVKAKEIDISSLPNSEIDSLLQDMNRLLANEDDGVALAAPQIGAKVRIFVVSPKVFNKMHPLEQLVYINPEITHISSKKKLVEEGCLSVRGVYGKTRRSLSVTVSAYNREGKKFVRRATGLLAHIFQHEIDHLDGILFDSHASDLKVITEENKK